MQGVLHALGVVVLQVGVVALRNPAGPEVLPAVGRMLVELDALQALFVAPRILYFAALARFSKTLQCHPAPRSLEQVEVLSVFQFLASASAAVEEQNRLRKGDSVGLEGASGQ